MSLQSYQWPRLLVLRPSTSVLEAARALEENGIGAVVVQHHREVVGIVTDRDLALRVIGQGLDPRETTLDRVMTRDVATLPPQASRLDALRLMRMRGIRRVPLVDDSGGIIGIVTLDDLLADESAPYDELAEVVRAQVGPGGPAALTRQEQLAAKRRASRREASHRRFVKHLREGAGLESIEQADAAALVVLSHLVRRLTPDEAMDLIAQLPLMIADRLIDLPPGPDKAITLAAIEEAVSARLAVDAARARTIVGAVARTLDDTVSPGQMEDIRAQLPKDLREAFTPATSSAR